MRLPAYRAIRIAGQHFAGPLQRRRSDEVSAYFAPRIKDLIGGERGLGQALEDIRQCARLARACRHAGS